MVPKSITLTVEPAPSLADYEAAVAADPAITTGFVWIDPLDSGIPFAVGLGGDNDFTVTGLNDENVVVNGSTDASIQFGVENDSVDANVFMAFFGEVDNVVTANEPESCPDDGNFTLGFEMNFDVTQGDENLEASAEWEVHVDFLGDGMAHVEVHAEDGDFEVEGDQNICEPPL